MVEEMVGLLVTPAGGGGKQREEREQRGKSGSRGGKI